MEEHNALGKEQKYSDISVWVGIRKSHTRVHPRAKPENNYNNGSGADSAAVDKAEESYASRQNRSHFGRVRELLFTSRLD